MRTRSSERGSALLTVLWLSAALSVIAFTVANTVRGETERATTAVEALRAQYVAQAAIERVMLWVEWGPPYYRQPTPVVRMSFPGGDAAVEIIPESAKLNVNAATPEELMRLLGALDVPAERAQMITGAILDWRSPAPGGGFTQFDQFYLTLGPTFRARHASFGEIEELLLVRGMTPELFYGRYERDAAGNLTPRAGLKDCLTVYGGQRAFDVNSVEPAVMRAIGVSPDVAYIIAAQRRVTPFRTMEQLSAFNQSGPAFSRLGLGNSSICTLRATAWPRLPDGRLSDLRRSVAALVKFLGPEWNPPHHVLRWYDNAFITQ